MSGPGALGRTLLLATLGVALGVAMRRSLGGAPGPSPGAPATPRGPFPADYPARLRRELAWAAGKVVTPAGKLLDAAVASEADRPLLDPDPARWGETLALLPELGRVRAWLAGGGTREELAEDLARELREVDREVRDATGERPFFPVLYLAPREAPVALPEKLPQELRGRAPRGAWAGWAGTAIAAFREGLAERERRRQEYQESPSGPIEGAGPLALGGLVADFSVTDYLASIANDRRHRVATRAWTRAGIDALHEAAAAARRALEDPATPDREFLALLFSEWVRDMGLFTGGGIMSLDPEVVAGGPARTPPGNLLLAALDYKLATRMGHARGLPAARREALEVRWRAALPAHPGAPFARERRAEVVGRLVRLGLRRGEAGLLREVAREHLDFLAEARGREAERAVEGLLEYAGQGAEGLAPPALRRLDALARAWEGRLGARSQADLRRFREAFAPVLAGP